VKSTFFYITWNLCVSGCVWMHVCIHAQAYIFVKVAYCQALKDTLLLFLLFNFNLIFLIYI